MRFQHVYHAVHFEPLAITPSAYASIAQLLETRLGMTAQEWEAKRPEKGFFGALPVMRVSEGIAEIPVFGPLGKGLGTLEKSCGATSFEDVAEDIAEALGRRDVSGILLNIDSPGGSVNGTPELGALVARASEGKPVLAFTDSLMASAAYWIGSQADMIVASMSASVGSVGVILPWVDRSRQAEAMGIKVDPIKNTGGTFKGMGMPGTSLTEAQRAHLQARADEMFGMFKAAILQKRPGVKADALQGQTLLASAARDGGLIDDVGDMARARASLQALIKMRG